MTPSALLVDIDSTIPNLALMHISTWKKAQGYEVGWNIQDPTEVWASVVFDWNKHKVDGLRWMHPGADIHIGGSGYDLNTKLPDEVDRMMPDYSLYPDCDYSLGFTTRGCIRKCPFCVVPIKEGKFRVHQHPREFYNPAFKKITFLDNNILADPDWFQEVADWCISKHLRVDFNQGLDLRLVTQDIADTLADLPTHKHPRFAFDNIAYEDGVVRGLHYLERAGFKARDKAEIYVYCDGDHDFDSALYRAKRIRELGGGLPYIMMNRHAKKTQRLIDLTRWCRPWIFWSCTWEEYLAGRGRDPTVKPYFK